VGIRDGGGAALLGLPLLSRNSVDEQHWSLEGMGTAMHIASLLNSHIHPELLLIRRSQIQRKKNVAICTAELESLTLAERLEPTNHRRREDSNEYRCPLIVEKLNKLHFIHTME
jgi:hypothetical protein